MKKTLIIIPAYNEEKNVPRVIEEIQRIGLSGEIIVIDDGSTDSTPEIAGKRGVKVISLPFNLGYGAALQTGYKYALEKDYDVVVQIDADGQHDPRCIKDLTEALKTNSIDVAIGSRFLEGGRYRTTFLRHLGIVIFGLVTSSIIRQRVTDPTSGFQALNQRAVEFLANVDFPSDFPDADIIISLKFGGFKIKEVPVTMHPRLSGKSTTTFLRSLYYVYKMFLSILATLCRKKPEGDSFPK